MKTLGIITLFITSSAFAQMSFEDVWKNIEEKSQNLKSHEAQIELTKLEKERANRHWLPNVKMGASIFNTNDPGGVFFNNLGQGAIAQADFNPDTLNNPDTEQFSYGQITVELPLYEGGMRAGASKLREQMYKATQTEYVYHKNTEYTQSLSDYVTIARINHTNSQLKDIKGQLKTLIEKYSLGSKKNPVGRSGLLGLKSVLKRIDVTEKGLSADKEHRLEILSYKSQMTVEKLYQIGNLRTYLIKHLKQNNSAEDSSLLKANKLKVKALSYTKEMEQARYLPRVALFASQNKYQGNRDDNSTQTIGVSVQWALFDPDNYGRKAEASQRIVAKLRALEEGARKEAAYKSSLKKSLSKLNDALEDVDTSAKYLAEQVKLSFGLYKRGSMNALQLAEVLNRRIDLEVNKLNLEQKLIDVSTKQYLLSN